MKIGELARLTDVSPKAIRRYEALGLVSPVRRSNGYREYGEYDVRAVQEARALNLLGIPVEEIRPFLECLRAGGDYVDDCPASLAEYRKAIDALTARIDALTDCRDALERRLLAAANRGMTDTTSVNVAVLPNDLPVPLDDGAAAHLVRRCIPPVKLPSTKGGSVDLSDLADGRSVVYLYPLTGRPEVDLPDGWTNIPGARGCTAEACGFRDHHQQLLDAGVEKVFGLSSQGTAYQREVVKRLNLPFAMLSDPSLRLASALALPTFKFEKSLFYTRLTLVVRGREIEHVFYPVFPPDEHAGEVLDWLQKNPI